MVHVLKPVKGVKLPEAVLLDTHTAYLSPVSSPTHSSWPLYCYTSQHQNVDGIENNQVRLWEGQEQEGKLHLDPFSCFETAAFEQKDIITGSG